MTTENSRQHPMATSLLCSKSRLLLRNRSCLLEGRGCQECSCLDESTRAKARQKLYPTSYLGRTFVASPAASAPLVSRGSCGAPSRRRGNIPAPLPVGPCKSIALPVGAPSPHYFERKLNSSAALLVRPLFTCASVRKGSTASSFATLYTIARYSLLCTFALREYCCPRVHYVSESLRPRLPTPSSAVSLLRSAAPLD